MSIEENCFIKRMRIDYGLLAINALYGVYALVGISLFYFSFIGFLAGEFSFMCPALFLLPIVILFFIFLILVNRFHDSPAEIFILVAFPAVIAFALFLLPGSVPDETVHIAQTVHLFERGTSQFLIPDVLSLNWADYPQTYSEAFAALHDFGDWSETYLCPRPLMTYYPHLYLPSAVVMSLGGLLDINIYACLYAARIVNGIIYIVAGYCLIKLIPLGKTFLTIYLLNPIAIQQASSMSADSIVNTIVISFVVYFVFYYKLESPTHLQRLILIFLALLTCVSKFIYAPLILLLVLLFRKIVNTISFRNICLGLAAFAIAGSVCIIAYYHGPFMADAFELLRNPLELIKVFLKSFWVMGTFWFESFAGRILGSLNINIWGIAFYIYFALLLLVCFYNDDEWAELDSVDISIFTLITLVEVSLIILSMREWTLQVDHRSDIIMGVQGRYLLPFLMLPFLGLVKPASPFSKGRTLCVSAMLLCFVYACNIISIISFFIPHPIV